MSTRQEKDKKINNLFDEIFGEISTFLFLLVLLIVFLQVIVRYFFSKMGFSLPWTEEISRYILIVTTFFGVGIATFKKDHISILFLYDKFPLLIRILISFFWQTIMLIICGFIVIGCCKMSLSQINTPVGAVKWLKVGYMYALMMLAFIVVFINLLRLDYQLARQVFFTKKEK